MRMGKLLRVATISAVAVSALSAVNAQPNLMLLAQDPSFETTISGNTWGSNPTTWFAGQFFGGGAWEVVSGSIDIANQPGVAPNGDPASMLALGAGLVGMLALRRRQARG
ncbi:MAG: PEP-CTERM sorting domain-containing protein [Armatimonadetes bacterium]|nr:PEP-CTERM sorting domain-containing protein [Armatimonadota bacterium]